MAAIVDIVTVAGKEKGKPRRSVPANVDAWRGRVDGRLAALIRADEQACPTLVDAMRYSLLAPGKRVRPLLALLTALDFGRDPRPLLDFGCALELVHCASLMLDDLLDCQRHGGSTGKDCGVDVDKAGSVHQLGEATLRERLAGELDAADVQLGDLGIEDSQLRSFVDSLFRHLLQGPRAQ